MIGFGDDIDMGPLANPRRPDVMEQLITDAKAKGATVRLGGEAMDSDGYFYQLTVLTDVPLQADIMNNEPFGPARSTRWMKRLNRPIACRSALPPMHLPRACAQRILSGI